MISFNEAGGFASARKKSAEEGEQDPILTALEVAGVTSPESQASVKRALAACELELLKAYESADKGARGLALDSKKLAPVYSEIMRRYDRIVLAEMNFGRGKDQLLTELPPAISERIGRFSENETEQAEVERVRAEMRDFAPTELSAAHRAVLDMEKSRLPEALRGEIDDMIKTGKEAQALILESVGKGLLKPSPAMAQLRDFFNTTGKAIYDLIDKKLYGGQGKLESIPPEYSAQLPGRFHYDEIKRVLPGWSGYMNALEESEAPARAPNRNGNGRPSESRPRGRMMDRRTR